MSNPASLPPLIEGYGRKRKKRTSIETNIKLTLEKRFLDVSLTLAVPPCFLNFVLLLFILSFEMMYYNAAFLVVEFLHTRFYIKAQFKKLLLAI